MQKSLLMIWELTQILNKGTQEYPLNRKPHFPSHCGEMIEFGGSLIHSDTETFEGSHPDVTVHTWGRTSKR
jgi:hypothetical protein